MNKKEKILWLILTDDSINRYKFKRQFQLGKYVLDFYSEELRLAIEFKENERELHNNKYHIQRKNFFKSEGIELLAVPESFFHKEIKHLLNKILNKRRQN